jgi:hypothetical protein
MSDEEKEVGNGNVVPFARRAQGKAEVPPGRSGKPQSPRNSEKTQKPPSKQALLTGSSDWKTIRALKAGQILPCRIVGREDGGYAVETRREGLPGFLPSNSKHEIGDDVQTMFVRVDQRRLLLSERFSSGGFKPE